MESSIPVKNGSSGDIRAARSRRPRRGHGAPCRRRPACSWRLCDGERHQPRRTGSSRSPTSPRCAAVSATSAGAAAANRPKARSRTPHPRRRSNAIPLTATDRGPGPPPTFIVQRVRVSVHQCLHGEVSSTDGNSFAITSAISRSFVGRLARTASLSAARVNRDFGRARRR